MRYVVLVLLHYLWYKYDMSVVEKEISLDYRFDLPAVIVPVHYGGNILIIAREE